MAPFYAGGANRHQNRIAITKPAERACVAEKSRGQRAIPTANLRPLTIPETRWFPAWRTAPQFSLSGPLTPSPWIRCSRAPGAVAWRPLFSRQGELPVRPGGVSVKEAPGDIRRLQVPARLLIPPSVSNAGGAMAGCPLGNRFPFRVPEPFPDALIPFLASAPSIPRLCDLHRGVRRVVLWRLPVPAG